MRVCGFFVGLWCCAAAAVLLPRAPTWQLNMSTIAMPCNYSGYFDPAFGARFGMISYDWSQKEKQTDYTYFLCARPDQRHFQLQPFICSASFASLFPVAGRLPRKEIPS